MAGSQGIEVKYSSESPLLNKKIKANVIVGQNIRRRYRTTSICVHSKAAILTLFWSFLIGIIYGIVSNPNSVFFELAKVEFTSLLFVLNAISLCFYPLSGYLADNKIGKYAMITKSLKILIVALLMVIVLMTIFVTLSIVSADYDTKIWNAVFMASVVIVIIVGVLFYIAMNVSFAGFNANIIQFGMEQLHDSPTDHQSLFIYWYVWIYYLVQLLILQPWTFFHYENTTSVTLFGILGLGSFVMVAVTLCIAHRKKHWFLINPARINPYKLVYRITHFARHHKVPVRRSAFTYCEDEIPTGLDLAKTKYGGPFTTEEVEDVKAFYGIIKLILSLGPVFFLSYASDPAFFWYTNNRLPDSNMSNNVVLEQSAYQYFYGSNIVSSLAVISLIAVYLILRPLWCCYSLNMLKRIGLGIIFKTMTLISMVALIISLRPLKHSCMFPNWFNDYLFYEVDIHSITLYLPLIPRLLYGIGNALLYTGLFEFLCAQSPPSMKGLLIGLSFATKGIFQAVGAAFVIPFSFIPRAFPSCGLWYYAINVGVAIAAFVLFTFNARKYKYRQRDEICDVYRYAEDYYSNVQEESNYD